MQFDAGIVAGYLHYYESLHGMCPVPFEGMKELLKPDKLFYAIEAFSEWLLIPYRRE